jgi:hypothetical protein
MNRLDKGLQKRLQTEFYKLNISKSTYPYKMTMEIIKGARVNTVIRSGMYGSTDFTKEVIKNLTELGIECVVGSNAPRGGKKGTYVEITAVNIRTYTINKILYD